MLSRMKTGLSGLSFSFWNNPNPSEQKIIDINTQNQSVEMLRKKLETSPQAEASVLSEIQAACTNLAEKIDAANNSNELAWALLEWEKELDTLSQALPIRIESLRTRFTHEIEQAIKERNEGRFHATLHGHKHLANRVLLLMKHGDSIRNLRGYDSSTGLWGIAITILQTMLASAMNDASWSSYLVVMLLVGSVLNHSAGMAIHEATHNLAAPTPLLNRIVSILANLPIGVPHQANFERYHIDHHLFLGQPQRDNDLPSPALARWVGNSTLKKAIWVAFYPLAYAITQEPDAPNWKQITNILTQLMWDAGIAYFLGPWALTYLLGSTLIGFSALNPVATHWIDEHFERDEDGQETHSYYGWLNWLNFNVGYHNEHHDFPDIPGSKLPELHRIAKDHYEKQHSTSSWLQTSWRFITDPKISAHNRIIRTTKSQHRTNTIAISSDSPRPHL